MTGTVLNDLSALVLPKVTSTIRNLMVAEIGTVIYNTTTNKINICKAAVAAAASWEAVTSVEEA
ncbi:MAG: hypothetical protein IIC76_12875 [Bacteroidetes bacterium]|nr:hypothetical protein [Bacteroidota bacterium]